MQNSKLSEKKNPATATAIVDQGKRLRTWRRHMKMNQDELAAELDVSTDTLHRYESGLNSVGAAPLRLLYEQGLNIHWLLSGNEAMLRNRLTVFEAADEAPKIAELGDALETLQYNKPRIFSALVQSYIDRSKGVLRHIELEKLVGQGETYESYWLPDTSVSKAEA